MGIYSSIWGYVGVYRNTQNLTGHAVLELVDPRCALRKRDVAAVRIPGTFLLPRTRTQG